MNLRHDCIHCNNNFCDFFMEAFADSEDGIIWPDCDICDDYMLECPKTDKPHIDSLKSI